MSTANMNGDRIKVDPLYCEAAIKGARQQVAKETAEHQKRMEFWNGYITAMEEVDRHRTELD